MTSLIYWNKTTLEDGESDRPQERWDFDKRW